MEKSVPEQQAQQQAEVDGRDRRDLLVADENVGGDDEDAQYENEDKGLKASGGISNT